MTFFTEHIGQNLQAVVRLECEMPGQCPVKSCCDGSYVSPEDKVSAHPSQLAQMLFNVSESKYPCKTHFVMNS